MSAKSTATINDPIAHDVWSFAAKDGSRHKVEIAFGRPFEVSKGDRPEWACPLFIQGNTRGVKNVRGVGPVDALLNAAAIVRTVLDGLDDATPREGND